MSAAGSNYPEVAKIRKEVQRIPGRDWGFHSSVPVGLIARHPEAQRPSPLAVLRKKGKYDPNKAGLPRLVPNGAKFYAVTGATRTEWATENGQTTTPAEVWPDEMSVRGMAEFFLDELQHVEPNIRIKQRLGEVAGKPVALAVKEAREELDGTAVIGALRTIYGKKNGASLLPKTVKELKRTWPRSLSEIPATVISGMALLLDSGETVARKWRGLTPQMLLQRARTRQAQHGGKGTLASHVAMLLKGAR
jgi:hypothetical protein